MLDGFDIGMIVLLIMIAFAIGHSTQSNLSQETLDDICINLAQNETAIGEIQGDGTLVCTIPSFDSTHNIVVKRGGE